MTILDVVQRSSIKLGSARPTQIYASTDRTMYDVQAIIAEAVDAILEAHDWQLLKTIATITGDATTTAFPLSTVASDYYRMLKTASFWSSRYQWAINHINDTDQWLQLLTLPYTQVTGSWSVFGGNINILDTMATGDTAKFFYISNKIVNDNTSTPKAAFTADDDTFRLDEELLRLAIIWKWKAEKGRDYTEDMANYEQKLYQTIDKDGGSKPIISGGVRRNWRDRGIAWPGTATGLVP
jgi:hypothetical protein